MSANYRILVSLLSVLLLAVGLFLSGCQGCGGLVDPFPRGGPDDDDDTTDDDDNDDDDSTVLGGPLLEVTSVAPDFRDGETVGETVHVGFVVNDSDSSGYTVEVTFSTEGASGVFNITTLLGEDDNLISAEPGLPVENHANSLAWDAGTDLVGLIDGLVLKLCPFDNDGNSGACVLVEAEEKIIVGPGDGGAFCQEGHLEITEWSNGEVVVPLSDGNCLNYQISDPAAADDYSAQFLVILVNPTPEDVVFTISPISPPDGLGDDDDSAVGDDDDSAVGDDDDSALPPPPRSGPPPAIPGLNCTPDVTVADIHNNNLNFEIRQSIGVDSNRQSHGANLYALGEHVALYVDDETPINWDADCSDPNNAVEESDLPAFGFDNCDLDEVVDTIDNNIWPTLTALYGMPSDVDGNCRVTIFLSHRLNRLTSTNGDEADDVLLVKSFAEPDIDLWGSDLTLNPDSNEQEVIYLYAPDPVGFWGEQVALDDYLNFDVGGRVAVALQDLISYANHREVEKVLLDPANPEHVDNPPAEEDWLNDAMGLLAADLTGFGAIAYPDAWIYMDRSHLLKLQVDNTLEDFRDRGGQYLFVRYLHDLYGDAMIPAIIGAESQGADSVMEVAIDFLTFGDLVMSWATAMAVSGRQNPIGGQLVPDSVVPNFHTSSTVVVADPENPQPGELYAANGYQLGFNVRGDNRIYSGGASASGPEEIEELLVKTGNLDTMIFHPQTDFFGKVSGSYGVVAVLVGGLEQEINYLKIETVSSADLLATVIRVDNANPHAPSLTLEDVDGAKITTVRQLGALDPSGTDRYVIGRIDPTETLNLSESAPPPNGDDDDSAGPPPLPAGSDDDDAADDDDDDDDIPFDVPVTDTDRYGFSLSSTANIGIWIDRRISGIFGTVDLADPFFAVVPASDVPDAFDYSQWGFGPLPSHGPCVDPSYFSYPLTMPDWLGAQANLQSSPFEEDMSESPWQSWVQGNASLDCAFDHDQDGIPDVDEPSPASLMGQVLLRQAEHLILDPSYYASTFGALPGFGDVTEPWWDIDFIDFDSNEFPDDNFATEILYLNIGGRSVELGEEAVWHGSLPPGDYIVVVGDVGGSVGPYDLTLRVLGN